MIINFVGNFANGYVGEVGDANHLVREMEALGHDVQKVPQDIWKAIVEGESDDNWLNHVPRKADINIICKWHHFTNGEYIRKLREWSEAPVFYWVWDYMNDQGIPQWHKEMVAAADLYLGNDVRDPAYKDVLGKKYYFPFDVADSNIIRIHTTEKRYDVAFFGSCIGQGDRIAWLTEINKKHKVKIFGWNHEGWQKLGFDAQPPVYGLELAKQVANTKVILGFSVEPHTWGYWSNRVGKILTLGGFLLYQYAPGMELFLRDGVEYFSSIDEAIEKIDHFVLADDEREQKARIGWMIGQEHFSSKSRVRELMILIDRFKKSNGANWII